MPLRRTCWVSWVLLGATTCCLLLSQHPVSADPRPDFTLDLALYGTSNVQTAIAESLQEVADLNDDLRVTILSRYPLLEALASLVQRTGSTLYTDVQNLANALSRLVSSNDSEEFGQFDQLLARIQSTVNSIRGYETSINGQLVNFPNTCLRSVLIDRSLVCIRSGLLDLHAALTKLKNAIRPLLGSGESSEEHERSCRNPPTRYVYQVAYALRELRALLPYLRYVLTSTVDNIRTADAYLVRLARESGQAQDVAQYLAQINATYVHTAVRGRIDSSLLDGPTGLPAERTAINALTNLPSGTSLTAIRNALGRMQNALRGGSTAETNFRAALSAIGSNLATILTDLNIPRVDNSAIVRELILGLVSGCTHGRFCFYKYSELLFGVAGTGVAGVERCIQRERNRLDFLRDTLLRDVTALGYDYEDLAENLAVCNGLDVIARRRACVQSLEPSYTALADNYPAKFNNLFATGTAEAIAAKHRLTACVRALQANIIDGSLDDLLDEIRQCQSVGPTATVPAPVPVLEPLQ